MNQKPSAKIMLHKLENLLAATGSSAQICCQQLAALLAAAGRRKKNTEFIQKFYVPQFWPINTLQTPYSYGRNGHVQRAARRVNLPEVQRTEPLAKTFKDPAIGPWPFPSPSPHKPIQAMLMAAVLALFALPSYAQQSGGWGNAREFNLTNAFSASSEWSTSGSTWRTSDAFERSAPSIAPAEAQDFALRQGVEPLDQLLDVIASAEAGPAGYDAIHMSASRLPPAPPTQLTLAQIFAWIDATPNQHHAIGRYQFIPSTLARLVEAEGISLDQRFSRDVQRQLAARLVAEAGYSDFLNGGLNADGFMDNLARIWAGLPLRNGNSAYHNYAGNRATITRATFSGAVEAIYGP